VSGAGRRWWRALPALGSAAVTPPPCSPCLRLQVEGVGGRVTDAVVEVRRLLLAGYTGRDRNAVLAHVHELEALGVAPPARIPSVFVVDPSLVELTGAIRASGPTTSGEVEVVLIQTHGELLVGVGSDHTDRAHEVIDVDASKGMCAKPVAPIVWRHRDVSRHWDELELRSWIADADGWRLYQEGTLSTFLTVDALLDELGEAGFDELEGAVVFGGTLPTIGGLSMGDRFRFELSDPVLERSIGSQYDVTVPPPVR